MCVFLLFLMAVGLPAVVTCACAELLPKGGARFFNFAPEDAPDVKPFVKITGNSVYGSRRGYGWLDAEGDLEKGKWAAGESNAWESRRNLNVVCRIAPDDLARSYYSGPATFAVDLNPGRYEIWLLTGDAGLLEYVPYEPFRIVIEGKSVYEFKLTPEEFYRNFETPQLEDDLTEIGVWKKYVESRFRWVRTVIEVGDGQLDVTVKGDRRDTTVLNFLGDYAITEMRDGPKNRFGGSLCAMIIMSAGNTYPRRKVIDEIDAWRQENFRTKWPLASTRAKKTVNFAEDDYKRGYTMFFPNPLRPANEEDRFSNEERKLKVRATTGEYVPLTFGICPLMDLGDTKVKFSLGKESANGSYVNINVDPDTAYGVVKYVARATGRGEKTWKPTPEMIVPTDTWRMINGVTKQFWLTYRIPEEMSPGEYRGEISVTPEKGEKRAIEIELEVLPFKLLRPTHLSVGMTYFSPVQYAYFGEERFWKRVQTEFRDMRAHNMTCVQYTGIHMDDYHRIDKAFGLYRSAGFENPIDLLESYGVMCRLRREGVAWDTDEFQVKYVQFVREFLEEANRRKWPPIIINFGDEFTNRGLEEFGARVARNLKSIPGITTGADTNGYKEVTLLAPEVDIVGFNNGWDGPKGVNRGKRLLNKETVDLIIKAGSTPWLVNVGIDRFSNGYWLWKMANLGVRGKMEWMYRGYNGMPFNNFDGNPMRAHIVYPGPDGTSIPSLNYEWMRMGLDDLAYLYTLEKTLDDARRDSTKSVAVAKGEGFLKALSGMIEDDFSKYIVLKENNKDVWPIERYDRIRSEVTDLILEIQKR
jgi:hypothetical protein